MFPDREQLIVVPDITGGALCSRLPDVPSSRPTSPSSSFFFAPSQLKEDQAPQLKSPDNIRQEFKDEQKVDFDRGHDNDNDDDEEEEEELAAVGSGDQNQKRLSMESGYSASEKQQEDDVVAVEMREQPPTPLLLLDQSGLPSERLSLPSSQTDGKLANRDSGIDSISSPSHSEELCFAGVDDVCMVYPCSPALPPHLSSSSLYAGEEEQEEAREMRTAERRIHVSEEGDSDLEEEEAELTLVLTSPQPERNDSVEVRPETV